MWLASDPRRLSPEAAKAIRTADRLGVSVMSVLEIAVKHSTGRLRLDFDVRTWVQRALTTPKLTLLSLSPEIALLAAELRTVVGKDPGDCVIAATALVHGAPLVTRDARVAASGRVRCIW